MKLVLDTDVLLAAARSRTGASRMWLRAVLKQEVELLVSVPLMLEYEAVLMRPEHLDAFGARERQARRLLDKIAMIATPVVVAYLWRPTLRDPDDEFVLEAAVNGGAELLLTFNLRDFAGAQAFGIKILRPGPAWRELMEVRH